MLSRRFFLQSSAASAAYLAFGVSAARAANAPGVADAATIKIGMVLSVTGPGADGGKYSLTGAKIALDRVNKAGGVLGKQVELVPLHRDYDSLSEGSG